MHKWDKRGETIAGVLLNVGAVTIDGKKVPRMLLQFGSRRIQSLMPYDLAQKVTRALIGCQLRIKYLGDDENVRGGPNNTPMKIFSVLSKGTPSENIHGVAITDEDIPF